MQGADRLDGGAGIDRVDYSGSGTGIVIDLLTPGSNTGEAAGDTYISIENVLASSFGDTVRGTDGANTIFANGGDDRVEARDGDDSVYGADGNDTLIGNAGNDSVLGGNLNDWLYGNAGNDLLLGDNGVDRLYGGSGTNTLFGGTGDDYLRDDDGNTEFNGGIGIDTAALWGSTVGVTASLLSGTTSLNDTLIAIENLLGSNIGDDNLSGD